MAEYRSLFGNFLYRLFIPSRVPEYFFIRMHMLDRKIEISLKDDHLSDFDIL